MLRGERVFDKDANYIHTRRFIDLQWNGEPTTLVVLRSYIKRTRKLVAEMTVSLDSLQLISLL